jgi:hypothetical protein
VQKKRTGETRTPTGQKCTSDKKPTTMICNTISEYLKCLDRFNNVHSRIVNGKMFVQVKNNWVAISEYLAHNSKPVYQPLRRDNPDGSNIYFGIKTNHTR